MRDAFWRRSGGVWNSLSMSSAVAPAGNQELNIVSCGARCLASLAVFCSAAKLRRVSMSARDAVERRRVEGRPLLAPDCTTPAPAAAAAADSLRTERNVEFLSGVLADDVCD